MIDQSSPISPNISMYNERGGKEPTLIKDVEMKENKGAHMITEKQNKNECINEVKKVQPFEVDTADEPIMRVDAHGDVDSEDSNDMVDEEDEPAEPVEAPILSEAPEGEDPVPNPPEPPEGAHLRPVRVRVLPKPITPTRQQVEEHELTHMPYKVWCKHCVKTRGLNDPHRTLKHHFKGDVCPMISMDFGFMKRHDEGKMMPFVVLRDHKTRMTFSHKLLGKSTTEEDYSKYIVHAVMADLKSLDYKKIILKRDQEIALVALQERVRQLRNGINEQTILENSPVGESQSNGVVEKAVQEVETLAATLLSALEERLGVSVPIDAPIFAWLVEYVSVLLNRYRIGKDHCTPTQRHKAMKHHRALAEFGESVLYLPLDRKNNPIPHPEARFQEGVWLGLDQRTEEVWIGTPSGIIKCRTVRRRPEPERWSSEAAMAVRGTPWEPTPGVDPDLLQAAVRPPPDVDGVPNVSVPVAEPGLGARRARLLAKDFEKYGYTGGCPACRQLQEGGPTRKGHNQLCRARMEAEIVKEPEGHERIEGGYARVAAAAMRISEREERVPAPPAACEADSAQDPVPESAPPKKRHRDAWAADPNTMTDESGVGLPPAVDEPGTASSTTVFPSGTIGQGETQSASRGEKRGNEGGDEAREDLQREDYDSKYDDAEASSSMQAQATLPASSSHDSPMGSFNSGEVQAMDALAAEGRCRDMDAVRAKLGCKNDVSEVYSPPRIVTVAEAAGLRGGFSLDLTAPSPNGQTWDFAKSSDRRRALELQQAQKPYLLIGSPPCTAWSNLQNLNRCRPGGQEKVDEAQRKAKVHMLFCCRLYREQMKGGRYFLHEHPTTAESWKLQCMRELAADQMVLEAKADQCASGLVSRDEQGEGPARKPTTFYTNSIALQRALSRKCPGCSRHVQLVEGRAKAAQTYPRGLCRAVTQGIIEQARMDSSDMFSLVCQDLVDGLFEVNHISTDRDDVAHDVSHIAHDEDSEKCYWDDVNSKQLDSNLTRAARKEEVEAIHEMKVYQKVPTSMCYQETGKRPVGTRWIDTNKGDSLKPKHRSRLVAQEINTFKNPDLFSATPPLEYIKFLISLCASSSTPRSRRGS